MARAATGSAGSRTNRKFLIVALLFGVLTAVLFYALTSRGGSSHSSSPSAGNQEVVVAKAPISQRTTITADMLELKSVPLNTVISGAFTQINDAVGKVTKFPIAANQQVIGNTVIDTAHPTADSTLSLVGPGGRRGFSIQASQVLTAGGLLLPGDYVDVVWLCCKNGFQWQGSGGKNLDTNAVIFSRPVVQNVQIAAVAQSIVSSGPVGTNATVGTGTAGNPVAASTAKEVPDATTITLLVTPDEANILLMAEATGTLRAALRNPGDQALIPSGTETGFVVPGLIPPDLLKFMQDIFSK
jgi:pilus assembly protein CpaB